MKRQKIMSENYFNQLPKIELIPFSKRFNGTTAVILVLVTVVFSQPIFAQKDKNEKEEAERARKEYRAKVKAYRPIAVYEGGAFGYNRNFGGKVERDFDQLVIRNEKSGKIILAISYRSIVAAYVESASRPPRWVSVAGDIVPYNAASPLGYVIKAKYHRLFVQYRDPNTDVSGTAVFRFERLEAAENILNQLVVDLGLIEQEPIYVRRQKATAAPAPPPRSTAPPEKESVKQL